MKVLLVVPPQDNFIESYVTRKLDKDRELRPKLGLLYIAGALRQSLGITPVIVDCLAEGLGLEALEERLRQEQPEVVGLSVLTFNLLDCLAVAKAVRRACPRARVCFGGHHVSLYPKETLSFPEVDWVVVGDGEEAFAELVAAVRDGGGLSAVPGLGWKDAEGRPVLNEPRPVRESALLDDLPLPAHDLLDLERYTMVVSGEGGVAAVQSSRGCPGRCSFCDMRLSRFRYRSPDHVLRELLWLKELGAKEFFFVDDTFTVRRDRVLELCRKMAEAKLDLPYKVSARVDRIDEETISALARSGCTSIHYGVESGSQRVLDILQKGVTLDQIRKAFRLTKAAGLRSFAYMMLGVPGETPEEMERSIAFVRELQPDHVNYSICMPLPGSPFYAAALREGVIPSDFWLEYARDPRPGLKLPVINGHLDEAALRGLQDRAMRRFYSSFTTILRELGRTRSLGQLLVKARIGLRLLTPRR
jgi:radical SAM superfamily enzyme YgiQ (UPF0313 family)